MPFLLYDSFYNFPKASYIRNNHYFEHRKHDAQTHSARGSKSFSQFINRVNAIRSGEQVFSVQNARVIVILSGGASVFRIKNVSGGAFCMGEQVIFATQNSCEGGSARGSKRFSLYIYRVIANLHVFSALHSAEITQAGCEQSYYDQCQKPIILRGTRVLNPKP